MPPQFSFGPLPPGVKNGANRKEDEAMNVTGITNITTPNSSSITPGPTPRNKPVDLISSSSSFTSTSSSSSKRQKVSSWVSTYNRLLGGIDSTTSSSLAPPPQLFPALPSEDDCNDDDSFVGWDALSSSPIQGSTSIYINEDTPTSISRSISSPQFIPRRGGGNEGVVRSRAFANPATAPISIKKNTSYSPIVTAESTDPIAYPPTSTPINNMDPAKELMEKYRTNSPTSPISTYPFQRDSSVEKRDRVLRRIDSDVLPLGSGKVKSLSSNGGDITDNLNNTNRPVLRGGNFRKRNPEHIQQLYSPGYLRRSLSVTSHRQLHPLKKEPSSDLVDLIDSPKKLQEEEIRANLFGGKLEHPKNVVQLISLADSLSRENSPFSEELITRQPIVRTPSATVDSVSPPIQPPFKEHQIMLSDDSDDLDLDELDSLQKLTTTARIELENNLHKVENDVTRSKLTINNENLETIIISDDEDIDFNELERLEAVSRKKQELKPKPPPLSLDALLAGDSDFEDDEIERLLKAASTISSSTKTSDFKSEKLIRTRVSEEPEVQLLDICVLKPTLHRYLVTAVSRAGLDTMIYDDRHTILTAKTPEKSVSIILKGCWADTLVENDDIVHVIGDYDSSLSEIVVDNDKNLLVVLPDILVTCTNVADSLSCKRKVVLRDRIRTPADSSRYFIIGTLTHELFQNCLASNDFSTKFMNEQIKTLVYDIYLEELTLVGMTTDEAEQELNNITPNLKGWHRIYLRSTPSNDSKVEDHRGNPNKRPTLLSVSKIVDIEEEIWSPMFGLKGKIDATIEATIKQDLTIGKFLVPLELKTSKSSKSITHRAQTTLYTLLLSDRYNIDISCGVLYYSSMGEMIRIPAIWDEIRNLITARNNLVRYMGKTRELPPVIGDVIQCRNCARNDVCMVYHKATENGTQESSGVTFFDSYTEHLTSKQMDFFNKWDDLLFKERADSNRYLKEIWTMTSSTREKLGRCFGNMVIVESVDETNSGRGNSYTYILERYPKDDINTDLTNSELASGEPIVVSDESGHVCLAKGSLRYSNSRQVKITVDRRLTTSMQTLPGFNALKSQVFHSMLPGSPEIAISQQSRQQIFRIDKDEFGLGMSMLRNNLFQLFVKDGDDRRRRLVVDLQPPQFESSLPAGFDLQSIKLNPDQLKAVDKVLRAKDYALILGMPGTGKTTTIAAIVKALVDQKKTVLIASHTHSAVDNILLKLRNKGFEMLRLGGVSKVHPDIVPYVATHSHRATNQEEIDKYYFQPPVVGITCLGINNWLCSKRTFDYCIVDEASQITLPSCLGPLRLADKFVLVGDHFQLSPLVRNADALEGGLDVSLFRYLCENHPQAMVNLEHQYRMCSDIMKLSNKLIYDGRLKCGSEEVGNQKLNIPKKNGIDSWIYDDKSWLHKVLDEE